MKSVIALILSISISFAGDPAVKKVVYDLTTGNLETFQTRVLESSVRNISYYEGKLSELKVAVMIHGKAYKFFVKELSHPIYKGESALLKKSKDLQKRIASAMEHYGIEFMMCDVGMRHRNIKASDLIDGVVLVPNANIGLIDKQNSGYAYIPVK